MRNNKNNCRKGYTLAEVLIVLGIIGIVAAFMIPSVMTGVPSKYESLQKKAAYMLENTISGIVNNEVYYERKDIINPETHEVTHLHGLTNTYPVLVDGVMYGSTDFNRPEAKRKFCEIFASKFQLKDGTLINCNDNADFVTNASQMGTVYPTFTSAEGIQWIIPVSNFNENENKPNNRLILYKTSVDYKSGPNCAYVSRNYYNAYIKNYKPSGSSYPYIKTNKQDCPRPDIFVYGITPGGKLYKEEATSDDVPERNGAVTPQ